MVEIERKFLLKLDQFKPSDEGTKIRQGYLSVDSERVIRIRIAGEKGYITIKGKMKGISRTEFEYEIPKNEAEIMLNMCLNTLVEKVRYNVLYSGMNWEVDIFEKENEGLCIAEIELEAENQKIEKPAWIDKEVTFDKRYYNSWLSKNPYKSWEI